AGDAPGPRAGRPPPRTGRRPRRAAAPRTDDLEPRLSPAAAAPAVGGSDGHQAPTRMTNRIPPSVRAVFFDAVRTLIHPSPSAGAVYAEVGRRFGSRLDADLVSERFAKAFREEDARDGRNEHRTGEAREYDRWQAIVAAVLDDVPDTQGCFR